VEHINRPPVWANSTDWLDKSALRAYKRAYGGFTREEMRCWEAWMETAQVAQSIKDTMEAIKWRRSIRKYKADSVDESMVRQVIEAAILAPSGQNTQPWDFVVVTDPDIKLKLVEFLFGAHRTYFGEVRVDGGIDDDLDERVKRRYGTFAQTPVFVVGCLHRKRRLVKDSFDDAAYFWDVLSVGAAMENLIIAAASFELGTCWLGTPAFREEAIKELLGIPESVKIFGVTPLGYPDESPGARPRDPYDQVVHSERW
jgi:F420 biosynthesis protein FbiB-like protein